jgi:predicted acyltransferase
MNRIESLDVFRGLTIALMILVNNPGNWSNVYEPLQHAEWHGWTPTDLVFPFFLFIMAVSIPLALGKRMDAGISKKDILKKVLLRSVIIFFIGIALELVPSFDFSTVRIPGVLQRIALVYFFCSVLYLNLTKDQILISGVLALLTYFILISFVPVPGIGAPNLDPETNLGAWLDRSLLGGHLWSQSKTWDPEGLLGTLPSIANGVAGLAVGILLRKDLDFKYKLLKVFAWGVILSAIGYLWNYTFPINKKLWTSSFALYTSGVALGFFGVVNFIMEIKGKKGWIAPFQWFGMNAIVLYAGSVLVAKAMDFIQVNETESLKSWIYQSLLLPMFPPQFASLVFALGFVGIFLFFAYILYKRNIFIKV